MQRPFTAATRDSLSNLAASLNAGKDKAAQDSFFTFDLDRGQIEAMYRGDWLARKIVDIVPYDCVREWREWSGERAAVEAVEREERRLNLRKVLGRAMTLGRLYGGGAIILGTGEESAAALARPLEPEAVAPGGLKFLHAVSRWQLAAPAINRDPLDPYFGEPTFYEVVAPTRGALQLHPSRVVRFLGNELPDPSLGLSVWSDSILQALYDAIHAAALTIAGATSLMHEAKVDVVTVPNLSEHLSSAATTQQLSARFAYAAAMKSINNLLLLGDGETWARQRIDFGGLPEMVRTFLQVAAGAADIPVTRLLGQSPAGLSATGDSDTRNYYDMIAARQELDLRPQLERLDRFLLRSAGVDPGALTFEFRPLWQMDAASKATISLNKAQATQIYAGLNLWPAAVTARLAEAQLLEDGTYPGAAAIFGSATPQNIPAADSRHDVQATDLFNVAQPRDPGGRWTSGGSSGALSIIPAMGRREEEENGTGEHRYGPEEKNDPPIEPIVPGVGPGGPFGSRSAPLVPPPMLAPKLGGAPFTPAPPQAPTTLSPTSIPIIPGVTAPGPFARDPIPADRSGKLNATQKKQNNANGNRWGCHWCGSKDPGTTSGDFVGDHQQPTALNPEGQQQFIYPHCSSCSRKQGGIVKSLKQKGFGP